jgi:LuxR family maltose regulon positive regulatory protein
MTGLMAMTSGVVRRAAVPARKTNIPAPPTHLIARGFLANRLDGCAAGQITLVSAPAGYGKTTMLSGWAADRQRRHRGRVAWLSLDEHDDDVLRLRSAMLAALKTVDGMDADRLASRCPPGAGGAPDYLAGVADTVADAGNPVWLVLDDVHHVRDAETLESLRLLLDNVPDPLHLVLSSRSDPPIATLRRLRLAGHLGEIRRHLLAFTRREATDLLDAHALRLPDAELEHVLACTEGWPAAVRLAGIVLAEQADLAGAVARFLSDDRVVADYVFGEVLADQPADARRFLDATSVCDRFTLDLAEALVGRPALEVLERLQADAFVVGSGTDPQWYRYHPLIRRYSYASLQLRHRAEPLHGRASAWLATHDDIAAAVQHAVAAADADALRKLLSNLGLAMVLDGRSDFLRQQFELMPAEVMRHPPVALVAAAAALDGNDLAAADLFLHHVDSVPPSALDHGMRVLRAVLRLQRSTRGGDLEAALADLTKEYDDDVDEMDIDLLAVTWRAIAAFTLGAGQAAHADLRLAARLARQARHAYAEVSCLTMLASAAATRSDFVSMGEIAGEAVTLAHDRGLADSPICAYTYAVAAWSAYARVDRDSARRLATLAVATLGPASHPAVELYARCAEAAVRFDTGDRRAALRDWLAAWAEVGGEHLPPNVTVDLAAIQVRMGLAAGEPLVAVDAVDRIRRLPGAAAEVNTLHAHIEFQKGRSACARRLLEPVLAGELPRQAVTTTIDAWLLDAVLIADDGEKELTRPAVDAALELAVPLGALRNFVAAGPALRDILLHDLGRFGVREHFVVAVVAAVGPATPIAQPLSPRERELLAELPTMRTVDEIAGSLYISASTVKTHLRSIYAKLGVGTRRDAVAAARRQGLT